MGGISETLDLVKQAQAAPSEALQKSFTQATGLVAYDLEAGAKKLYPVLTPLRNMIGRVKGAGDTATRWKAITAINTNNSHPGVSEGNRGQVITETVTSYTAPYIGIGLENAVTFEADYAAMGFDDAKARAAESLLRSVMIQEERMILGGNGSMALGTTPTPTVANSGSGGTVAAGTYDVIAVAMTFDAFKRFSVAGGLSGTISKTNADGSTDSIPGGIAQKSAASSGTTTSGSTSSITATVAAVQGAVAYAWYVGTSGAERLSQITYINSALITSIPGSSQLASALPSADNSAQTNFAFDGLLTFALKSGTGATVITQATGTAGTGTGLTGDGKAGISEFDQILGLLWDNYKLQPDAMWLHRIDLINLSKKIIQNGTTPVFRFNVQGNGSAAGQGSIVGGSVVNEYLSPIDERVIPMKIHPDAVPGTILFTTKELPYPTSNIGDVFRIKTRREYYQLEWPLRSRKYEYGVYADEVLQHYAPFSLAALTNVGAS
jgi:hypothetical protein